MTQTSPLQPLQLLPADELALRINRLTEQVRQINDRTIALITDNAMIYYLTGRVFAGWIAVDPYGRITYFVRRPNHLSGPDIVMVRKPEEILSHLQQQGFAADNIGLDFPTLSHSDYLRLQACFPQHSICNISVAIRQCRAIKTPLQIGMIAESGQRQTEVYSLIPSLFQPGMTDLQLQIEIERQLRLHGCLGQFRIAGNSMELFMANILAGDNADNPTPYDFAMGGSGADPSLPVGADGSPIRPGSAVMVDANGNFTGYMTDMTRTFSYGTLSDEAMLAHQVSIEICATLSDAMRPGVKASDLYAMALDIASEAGLADRFMGHRQQAGFVGHGLGIEINEAPVIAPRSRDIIEEGNIVAIEPKFVIEGAGAVGIENTYLVLPQGSQNATRCLTLAPEQIISLL